MEVQSEAPQRAMPQYRSHKRVFALKLSKVDEDPAARDHTRFTPHDERYAPLVFPDYAEVVKRCKARVMNDPGYLVTYEDGFMSWSPTKAFEEGYTPLDDSNGERDMAWALRQLRLGQRVARAGWNGPGMFLFLVPGSRFEVNRPPLLGIYPEGTVIDYHAHVDMRTATGEVVPWLCSQTDLLAEDWELVQP